MRKPQELFILFFLLIPGILSAQQSLKDSLQTSLSSAKNDTNKVNILLDLGWAYFDEYNFDSCELYTQQAIQLAVKIKFTEGEASGFKLLGNCFLYQSEYLLARKYFNNSLSLYAQLNDKYWVAVLCSSIGGTYNYQGQWPEALKYYLFSLKIFEELDNIAKVADVYNNIGNIYYAQGKFKLSLRNYHAAVQIWKKQDDKEALALGYHNMAASYYSMKDLDNALKNYQIGLEFGLEVGYDAVIAACYSGMGSVCDEQKQPQKALEYLLLSAEIQEKLGQKSITSYNYAIIGHVYTELKQFDSAQKYLNNALEISLSIGAKDVVRESYLQLSFLDSSSNDFENAFYNYRHYVQYRDSLHNDSSTEKILELQSRYEFDKEQILLEQKEKERVRKIIRRNVLEYTLILLGILLILGIVLSLGFIKVSNTVSRALIFISLMLVFEFVLVLIDPYLDRYTKGEPIFKLLANISLASLIFPIHSFLEKKLKKGIKK